MTIEKLEEFASNGDKHLTGLDVTTGFPRADKPERPWFNKLFGDITGKINEVVDNIDELPPFDGGVLADTFVTMTVNDAGSIATNLRDFRSNSMTAKDFGVVGDGIIDDTENLRAYHDYCNRRGMPASYRGLETIVIDADAQVIVSTDWDLNGCPINVINGNNAVPSSSTLKTTFIVSDPDTPIVEYTGSLAPENCVENSLTPTKGLVDTAGYAHLLDGSTLIPNRAGTGTSSYRQSFHILHDGHVALPLSQKINGSTVTIEHRENSKTGRLNIRNVSLNADANWNQLKLISVERNQVCIDGFIINHIAANPLGNISSLIDVYRAASFELKNVTCKGIEYSTSGTYVLGVSGCAELTLDNIQIATGWGWMGTNYINGLYASKCVVDRIDCHASMHNVYTDSCTFTSLGINVGWGGGVLQMTKTTLIDSSAVAFRPDYGSYFFGDIIINGVIVQSGEKSVVDMVKAGAVIGDTHFPKNITVNDVLYSEKSDSELKQGTVVYLRMADTSTDVKAPLSVTVSNVRASSKRNLVCMIDYGSATGWGGLDSTLSISDVSCATFKVYVIQSKDAGIIPVNLTFNARDIKTSNGLWAYISHPINKFNIDNVDSIDVFEIPRDISKSISQRVNIKNSVIINRKSTAARYDLTSTSWLNNIKYFNCEFEGAVDISGAQALQGCTFKDSKAVLPEGVTQENAYTGWHKTLMPPVIP